MKRIYSLDLLKLVFAYIIAFFHFGTTLSPGPTAAVQIFFILSGFFLGRKFYSRSHNREGYDQWNYTLDHAKQLYPHYVFSLVIFFLYILLRSLVHLLRQPSFSALGQIFLDLYHQIPDLLLLQSAYCSYPSLNYPMWQLSALVIAGYFVYGLLCHNETLARKLIFPGAILMIQSLLFSGVPFDGNFGLFFVPLLRAFSPLCIGVLAYYFTTTPAYEVLKSHSVLFNLAAVYSLVTIFAYGEYRSIFLLTTVVLIWNCWDARSWINRLLNRRIFRFCGSFSFAVYANHALIARFLEARVYEPMAARGAPAPQWQQNLVYFALVTLYSAVTLFLVEKGKAILSAKKNAEGISSAK